MYVLLLVKGNGRCYVLCAKGRVAATYDFLQICGGDFGGRNVEGEDFEREILEGEVFPVRRPVVGQGGDLFWNEKAAIRGKALEYDFLKGELLCVRAANRTSQVTALTS